MFALALGSHALRSSIPCCSPFASQSPSWQTACSARASSGGVWCSSKPKAAPFEGNALRREPSLSARFTISVPHPPVAVSSTFFRFLVDDWSRFLPSSGLCYPARLIASRIMAERISSSFDGALIDETLFVDRRLMFRLCPLEVPVSKPVPLKHWISGTCWNTVRTRIQTEIKLFQKNQSSRTL